ncbi:PadR family transcriptional regulator [Clostridium sp. CF012]|uniref:PadR family transcriptional regulator n=1 Tax=Clostridium sp. CF012 TaxID=2843319 RepID=UPI001C0AC03E|nr:PadR family transcriptional regulator [Clostridium sp. CF012]MBU3145509.1 PadR family transcriptional regulator [Clostridium sp. CF012]
MIEGVILKVISKEETYGYEIYKKLQEYGFEDFAEGSLYPLLLRLEKNNLIKAEKKQSLFGPDRKYYSLTEEGQREMEEFIETWDSINGNVQKVWRK